MQPSRTCAAASTCSKSRNTGLRLSSTCLVRIAIACLTAVGVTARSAGCLCMCSTIPDSIEQTFLDEQLETLPRPADTAWKDQHSLIWISSFDESIVSKECKASLLRWFCRRQPIAEWANVRGSLSPDEASYIDEQFKKLEQRAGTQPPTLHQAILLTDTSRQSSSHLNHLLLLLLLCIQVSHLQLSTRMRCLEANTTILLACLNRSDSTFTAPQARS